MSDRKLVLSLFYAASGHHVAGWRHPEAAVEGAANQQSMLLAAQEAEKHKYDLYFLADLLYVPDLNTPGSGKRHPNITYEPLTILSALSTGTKNIGLAATVSTTFSNPYTLARAFSSLDHISQGRASWNIVTSHSDVEAFNFGDISLPFHDDRYRRAQEFLDVVMALWYSWDKDAFKPDKASGYVFDPKKVRDVNFKGEFYSVKGALNSTHSPQGHPVLIQAGQSEPGQEFAAKVAEVIFTAQTEKARAQAYYQSVKGRMAKYGRAGHALHILPGMLPVVGRTEKEAREKFEDLQDLMDPVIGLQVLAHMMGIQNHPEIDLAQFDLDAPLPPLQKPADVTTRYDMIIRTAEIENLTLRQLYKKVATSRGHLQLVGSAEQVAATLEDWFRSQAADGFNVMPPTMPGGLTDFNELVVPILQDRGLVQLEYHGETLAERLGLTR